FYPKGGDHVGTEGARIRKTLWDERYEFDGTKLQKFPLMEQFPLSLVRMLDQLAQHLQSTLPSSLAQIGTPAPMVWQQAKRNAESIIARMIALQEELDWECYRLYELLEDNLNYPI